MEFRGEIQVEDIDLGVINKQIMGNTKGLDKFTPPKDCWVLIACLNDGSYSILYFHVYFLPVLSVDCHHLTLDTGHIFTWFSDSRFLLGQSLQLQTFPPLLSNTYCPAHLILTPYHPASRFCFRICQSSPMSATEKQLLYLPLLLPSVYPSWSPCGPRQSQFFPSP